MGYNDRVEFSILTGKTLAKIDNSGDEIYFTTVDGERFKMFHDQDCCESVSVDDIVGDLADLIGSPILSAYEESSMENPKESGEDSFTWTFYRISTIKGTVVIKWYGTSNGYYSESVNFGKVA